MNKLIGNLKSKTSWFNLLLIGIGAAQQTGLWDLIPTDKAGVITSVIGTVGLVLRNLTTQSVEDKVK